MKGTVKSGKGRFLVTLLLVLLLIAAVLTISVTIGAVNVSAGDIGKILVNKISGKDIFRIAWEGKTENIIWNIRFPRVLMAFIVGAGLALCGVLMQALTKNPLADPYVLGISSGASAGAVCAILLGWFSFMGGYSVIFGATMGAAVSICLSLSIASIHGRITSTQLVLAGIATSALFSAFTNLMVYGINTGSDKTKMALYWMVGSLSGATWSKLRYVVVVGVVVIVVIFLFAKELDVLLLGDDVAETLGVDTRKMKLVNHRGFHDSDWRCSIGQRRDRLCGTGCTPYYAKLCGIRTQTADPHGDSGRRSFYNAYRSDFTHHHCSV